MKKNGPTSPTPPALSGSSTGLRAQLTEAQDTLRAIRNGEVDAVVNTDQKVPRVYTLEDTDQAYRILIESMNEGAVTLGARAIILYANRCFALLVQKPLEQVIGTSFLAFLSPADQRRLRAGLKSTDQTGTKLQVHLNPATGAPRPAQISIRPLARKGSSQTAVGMVITDLTEANRAEDLLRSFTHRLVQAQEDDRGSLALELHDRVTQLLCAALVRSQTLALHLPAQEGFVRTETLALCDLLGQAATEVENISRRLKPSVLVQLGLVVMLRSDGAAFARRAGISVTVTCGRFSTPLPVATKLALYRIFQEALENVHQHAHARLVTVRLLRRSTTVQLRISDDGVGFQINRPLPRLPSRSGFGLLSMRERAAALGGEFSIESTSTGTTVRVQIPLHPKSSPTVLTPKTKHPRHDTHHRTLG